jgi:hypothetical protein
MEQQHQTKIGKTLHADWEAETECDIGNSRVIVLRTGKHTQRGRVVGVATCVTGHKREGHFRSHRFNLGGTGGDLSRVLLVAQGKRGTEKAIRDTHAQALLEIDKVLAEAREYYRLQDEAAQPA